jgi:hypothetical protein
LARIRADRGLQDTKLGVIATASAAVQDGAGWLLLAISLALLRATGPLSSFGSRLRRRARLARPAAASPARGGTVADGHDRHGRARRPVREPATTQLIGVHSVLGAFMCSVSCSPAESARWPPRRCADRSRR